jgi:hypothetical protein
MPETPAPPLTVLLGLAWAVIRGGRRSLRSDALAITRRLPIRVDGAEHIPCCGPAVVVLNHYFWPGSSAHWAALAISSVIPQELVWVMTAAWTEEDTLWSRIKSAASVPLFPRLAQVYGLISMPPLPPRPHEVNARARAVRQILAAARRDPPSVLAIAPEGRDPPGGVLMRPHPGVGRMLYLLDQAGCQFYPLGIYEQEGVVVTSFGPSFRLELEHGLSSAEIDRQAADQVMSAIAAQLPAELRGVYG